MATYLMGIHDAETLLKGPLLGPLFETTVVLEHIKLNNLNANRPSMTYFRTKDGTEVDIMIECGTDMYAREIKTSRTLTSRSAENLISAEKLLKKSLIKELLAPVEKSFQISKNINVRTWHDVKLNSNKK